MSPETAVERVRSFIRWNSERLERLDAPHEAIAGPLGWRRGAEFWVPPPTWHDIFENDEDVTVAAAQALRDNGLLRTQAGPSLQCNVKIRKEVRRCYCVVASEPPMRNERQPVRTTLLASALILSR
jgi:hypothetical protein